MGQRGQQFVADLPGVELVLQVLGLLFQFLNLLLLGALLFGGPPRLARLDALKRRLQSLFAQVEEARLADVELDAGLRNREFARDRRQDHAQAALVLFRA